MSASLSSFSVPLRRPQILCIDSDAPGLVLLEAILSPRGFDIVSAPGPKEALEILARQKIDLILMGTILPGMDGFTLCRHLRTLEKFAHLPVILMSAIKSREDYLRGVESGADDFLIKPLDHDLMLARIKMLVERAGHLEVKSRFFDETAALCAWGSEWIDAYAGKGIALQIEIEKLVSLLVRRASDMVEKPRTVIVGVLADADGWQWHHYEYAFKDLGRVRLDFNPVAGLDAVEKGKPRLLRLGVAEAEMEAKLLVKNFQARNMPVENGLAYLSPAFCLLAVNYGQDVGEDHQAYLRQIVAQSRFLHHLSLKIREVDKAFEYGVYSLARAAESHDDDRGSHIYRVGDYCGVLAERLGLGEAFGKIITLQAALHDVGKIYTPRAILDKTESLSPEEWIEVKKHTLWGAKIIGGHPHLRIAQSIALNHHERFDGTGYPRGLTGDAIPIEARIALLADQYDALRMQRPHKEAMDHASVVKVLNHGDGRTRPRHFDPDVLKAFRETAFLFEEIFERRKG